MDSAVSDIGFQLRLEAHMTQLFSVLLVYVCSYRSGRE
jgi:hypothetical protein